MSWELLDKESLAKVKQQKLFEDQTAQKLTPLYEQAQNPIIKLFLHSIILDTMRHSDTYQMIIDLNERVSIGEEGKGLSENELKQHIKEEANMLKLAQEVSEAIKDEQIKRLVVGILEDERKHHRVLTDIMDILKKKSTEWDAYLYDLITGFP